MSRLRHLAAVALAVVALTLGGGGPVPALGEEPHTAFRHFVDVVLAARDLHGTEVELRDLVYSAISGMLRTLDPHTSFLSPEAYANMRSRQRESFHGLGILVGMRNGQLTVITPIEGTPASRMGLRAGDVIHAIEGVSTEAMNIDEAVGRLKGPKGTAVTIQVVRPGLERLLEITIVRDEIPQDTVRYAYMIEPRTGYIAISDFNRGTAQEVAEAIAELEASGMQRLVLDLRNNGGGLLDQAIEVADQFLPTGAEIVETRGRTADSVRQYRDTGRYPPLGLPLVVLVNAGTASAAEILSGAVQDNDVGLLVGTPTWGKGLVQTLYNLSHGAGLALTTARYHTPSGRLIQRDYSSWFDYATHPGAGQEPVAGGEIFYTEAGREVLGGRGITPDRTIEAAPPTPFVQYLLAHSAIFDFAVAWAAGHPIASPDWTPGEELLKEFSRWAVEREMTAADEMLEGLGEPEARETVLRLLHAEIFNAAFGFEARHRVLAEGDEQIQDALALFGEASELLAASRASD